MSEELPLTIIEARSAWKVFDPRELWRYRELLYFLTWRDIKVRYKQTVFGVLWALLQPLASMAAFTLFLGQAGGVTEGIDYPYSLFVFAGMLPWFFFAGAVATAGQSIVQNHMLVTKVFFPRIIIPLSAVGVCLLDFLIGFGMLMILSSYHGVYPTVTFLWVPVVMFVLLLAAFGIGTLLAALTVAYRDFRFVVPFLMQLWMFATPGIYMKAEGVLKGDAKHLLPLNPAHGLIVNFRQAVLGGEMDFQQLGISTAVSLFLLAAGCLYFRRMERSFADII